MEQKKNTSKRETVAKGGKNSPVRKRPVSGTRKKQSPVSSSRPKTSAGEPMSRDEVRTLRNMERRKKHRRNQLIAYGIAILAVIIIAVILCITVFFKISSISVIGDEVYSSSEIIEASKLKKGDNLFTFSKSDVSNDIERKLPYVENAEVKRSLTGKVIFEITAASADLAIDKGDNYVLLSGNCKVLEEGVQTVNESTALIVASNVVESIPGMPIEFENEDDIKNISKIAALISENKMQKISEINVVDSNDIKLVYDQRITLKIGNSIMFEKNVEFINAALKKIDTDDPYFSGVIDFTIENKAFINDNSVETVKTQTTESVTDEKATSEKTETTTEKPSEKQEETSTKAA